MGYQETQLASKRRSITWPAVDLMPSKYEPRDLGIQGISIILYDNRLPESEDRKWQPYDDQAYSLLTGRA